MTKRHDTDRRFDVGGLLADLFVLGGLALTGFGCWRIYEPAGYVVPGLIMVAIGVAAARPPAPGRRDSGDDA